MEDSPADTTQESAALVWGWIDRAVLAGGLGSRRRRGRLGSETAGPHGRMGDAERGDIRIPVPLGCEKARTKHQFEGKTTLGLILDTNFGVHFSKKEMCMYPKRWKVVRVRFRVRMAI